MSDRVSAQQLLRGHVARRANANARFGDLRDGLGVVEWTGGRLHRLCQPEVHHLDVALRGQHHVRRLQVTVHQPLRVRLVEGFGDLGGDLERAPRRHLPARQRRLQRFTGNVLHHDAGAAVYLSDLVNLADEGVVEPRRRPRFALQALACGGVRLERLGQELDGDLAPELRVVGQEHLAL